MGVLGFYTVSGAGVEDLLDLQGNGRAQLLDMQFSDGYWVTDLYQVKEAHWQRVNGWFGQLHYPALSRFTYRPMTPPVKRRWKLSMRALPPGRVMAGLRSWKLSS
jgi:hypothetical protein